MPMKLAYVTDQLLPADATDTIQLVSMASAFGEAGARVRLMPPVAARPGAPLATAESIAAHYGVEARFELAPVPGPYPAPFGLRGLDKIGHALRTMAALRSSDDEVVYTRNLPVVLAALGRTRLPVIYETYRPWPTQSRAKRLLFKRLAGEPRFAGLVLHSTLAAESYAALGFAAERLLVAHNGIDARAVATPMEQRTARTQLGLAGPDAASSAAPLCVYSGHISAAKGLGIVLDAAQRLPDLRFALVGSQGDGPIERRARTLPNVAVYPWQPPAMVATWLAAADILVIPPTRGPLERVGNTVLPIKTFQYLASGHPVIAAATPDLCEVLADGDNARLVPPDDLEAFVRALAELARDPAGGAALGARGRAAVLANTWRARAERVLAFIADAVPRLN